MIKPLPVWIPAKTNWSKNSLFSIKTDLNRIENNCEYLYVFYKEIADIPVMACVTTWDYNTNPNYANYNMLFGNVNKLVSAFKNLKCTPAMNYFINNPPAPKYLYFEDLNHIEQALDDMKNIAENNLYTHMLVDKYDEIVTDIANEVIFMTRSGGAGNYKSLYSIENMNAFLNRVNGGM